MTAPELIIALHNAGIRLTADGEVLRVDAPQGAMTPPLAAALTEHKPLLLAVLATLHDRRRDADWDAVRSWLIDEPAKTFTPAALAAARRIQFPVRDDEWPAGYDRRFRTALRVRGILAVLGNDPVPLGRQAVRGRADRAVPSEDDGVMRESD